MLAAQGGHAEAFRVLVDAGANLQHRGLSDTDLIGCAAEGGNVEILQLMLDMGHPVEGFWNPRSRDEKRMGNFTPLMSAAVSGHVDIVRILLAAGADRAAKFDGETAFMRVQQSIKFPVGEDDAALVPRWKAIAELLKNRLGGGEPDDEKYRREVESFSKNAARPECARLRQELTTICGKGTPWKPVPDHGIAAGNVVTFTLKGCKSEQELWSLQKSAREAKCHFVLAEPWLAGEPAKLVFFPTNDKIAVLAVWGTEGANYSVNTWAIIDWLRKLDRDNPFDVVLCNHESVGIRFRSAVKNAAKMIKHMAEICPGVLDEVEDDAILAASLNKDKSFSLRWD
jgi:hypothetical protein